MAEKNFELVTKLATSEEFRNYVLDLYKKYFENPGEKRETTMNSNCVEAIPCTASGDKVKAEPAKSILENMNGILKELYDELRKIDDAIYSPKNVDNTKGSNEPIQESLLDTLEWQRNLAAASLNLAIHIREGLW